MQLKTLILQWILVSVSLGKFSNVKSILGISDDVEDVKYFRRVKKQNSLSLSKRRLNIKEDSINKYKVWYNEEKKHKSIAEIRLLSKSSSIVIDGVTYSCENLAPYSIFVPDAKIFENNEEKDSIQNYDSNRLYSGKSILDEGKEVKMLISHDWNRRINAIQVFHDKNNVFTYTLSEEMGEEQIDKEYVTFEEENWLFNNSASLSRGASMYNDTYQFNEEDEQMHEPGSIFMVQSGCSNYRLLTVAVSFETSYCYASGGFDASVARIQTIVAMAANKFAQPGLCLSLKLAAIEGYCNYNEDPYRNMNLYSSGCSNTHGLYDDFMGYFKINGRVKAMSVHLFTGTLFHDGPVGCSAIGALCTAYGVDSMAVSNELTLQAMLFAHELAHNCGATHVNGEGYIMSPRVSLGKYGFDATNIYQMTNYLSRVHC